ncbi:MAG: FtsX-like permease family protein [Ruminococcaceae bacterium]|nr:FtsX-like permease family protein [Oscillospiraceae bacterium]
MVTTLLKSTLREIRQSLGRFLAILAIVGLGVGFLAGLRMSQPTMMATGVKYLDTYGLHDFRLLSTLGFTQEDVDAFAALDGIEAASGAWYTEFLWRDADDSEVVLIAHSLTENMNRPQLIAGRMPENGSECLGDAAYFTPEDIGRRLRVSDSNDEDTLELLRYDEYTLTGLAASPMYLNYERGTASIGSGSISAFLLMPEDAFDADACYEIYLTLRGDSPAYSDAYTALVDAMEPQVDALLAQRAQLRYETLYADATKEIQDGEQELADGWLEYRTERADAEAELADAYQELLDGEQEYKDGLAELEDGKQEYADGLAELEDGTQEYEDGLKEYQDGLAEYEDGLAELEDGKQEYADGLKEYQDGLAEYEDGLAELEDGKQEYADGLKEYQDGLAEYEDGLAKLEDGRKEYADGLAEFEQGKIDYADGLAELEKGRKEYADGLAELEKGKKEYEDGLAELDDAKGQLALTMLQLNNAKAQLEQGEAAYAQLSALYSSAQQLAQATGTGTPPVMIALLKSGTMPQLNVAVNQALRAQGSSLSEFLGGWAAAEAQIGESLTQTYLDNLQATLTQGRKEYEAGYLLYMIGFRKYNDGLRQLEDAAAELADAEKQLADAWQEILDGEQELADAKIELADAEIELADAWQEILDGEQELADAKAELADAEKELADAWQEILDGEQELADARAELADAEKELADAWQEILDGEQELADAKAELADAEKELADAWQEILDGEQELADARQDILDGEQELDDARKELDDGWQEYRDGVAEANAEFADAEKELRDGEQELADAHETLADLRSADTYTLTRSENTGYACFDNDVAIVAAISVVFPVFFFLVAALVCMTTMKRMVEEQRTQIGVLKAIGYSNCQIIGKYLFYSGSAAIIGSAMGYALGSRGLPLVLWEIYGIMYGFAPLERVFDPMLAVICFGAALLCSMGSTYLSCRAELTHHAAELLRPRTPKSGKRILLERIPFLWKRLSFLRKVSIRNVMRYRSRLLMMILGIGGCTALLVTGFGIQDSIGSIADDQYGKITLYDYAVNFQDPLTVDAAAQYLAEQGLDSKDGLLVHSGSTDVVSASAIQSVYLIVPAGNSVEGFISLHSEDIPIPFPGLNEAVINRNLADELGAKLGSPLRLRDDKLGTVEVTVSAVCDNYMFNYVYVSPETYRQQLGTAPAFKTLLVHGSPGANPYEESVLLAADDDVSSITVNESTRQRISSLLDRVGLIVIVLVLFAGALAFVVLYNLTNINITERIREIATIKVLGFYQKEVAAYVFREIIMLSTVGSLVGLLMGKALLTFVILQIDVSGMFFPTQIYPRSYLYSFLLTLVFTVVITWSMRPRLRKIDMAESLKSVE